MRPAPTVLRNALVHAPRPLGRVDLLVGGGVILAIAPRLEVSLPGLTEVDVGGRRVIPGLVDAHVHVTGGGGEAGPASRVPPLTVDALARGGVTSVVGVLGTDGTTRTMRELVAATLGLRALGLSAWCWTGSYQVPPLTLTGSVRDDLVFVEPIIGAGEVALSDHRSSQPTFEELVRLAADCHVGGLMSGKAGILHLHLGDGPRGLSMVRRALEETELPARVFHPTHVNRNPRLFEEALQLAARGVTADITAFPVEESDPAVPAATAVERFLDAGLGGFATVSSDGGGCLPTFDAHGRLAAMDVGKPDAVAGVLAELLRRGRGLDQVLPCFTSTVAALLRLPGKGTLEVGADADLVVLDEEHRVAAVMAGGRFLVGGERSR